MTGAPGLRVSQLCMSSVRHEQPLLAVPSLSKPLTRRNESQPS